MRFSGCWRELIADELKDPRLGFVTVMRVEITHDLKFGKVFVSIIGDRHVARQTMDALRVGGEFLARRIGARGRAAAHAGADVRRGSLDRAGDRADQDARARVESDESGGGWFGVRSRSGDDRRGRRGIARAAGVRDGLAREAGRRHARRRAGARAGAAKRSASGCAYFQQDPVPRNLRFLPDADSVSRAVPADLPADTLWVFCDMSDRSRAGEFLPPIERANIAQHRPSSRQLALRRAELHPRGRVLDGDVRAAAAERDGRADHARDRDLPADDDHDRHRRVHAQQHDGRRACGCRPR